MGIVFYQLTSQFESEEPILVAPRDILPREFINCMGVGKIYYKAED